MNGEARAFREAVDALARLRGLLDAQIEQPPAPPRRGGKVPMGGSAKGMAAPSGAAVPLDVDRHAELDAAMAETEMALRMHDVQHARANREQARAESAEAAHRALQAIAEDIAYQHAATIDGEYGCCHDEDALRAGGRVPEFDGDEFEPIPDDCPGKQTLDRHLDRIAREVR